MRTNDLPKTILFHFILNVFLIFSDSYDLMKCYFKSGLCRDYQKDVPNLGILVFYRKTCKLNFLEASNSSPYLIKSNMYRQQTKKPNKQSIYLMDANVNVNVNEIDTICDMCEIIWFVCESLGKEPYTSVNKSRG